jgi:hypothetical protein
VTLLSSATPERARLALREADGLVHRALRLIRPVEGRAAGR